MLEAILFGHRKGAFTGASGDGEGLFRAADGGTLLLDEIAEIPLPLQAKLLRALQEREILPVGAVRAEPVDLRVIASANRDLAAEVAAGRFRADLYWRLNVMPVTLPPLRARRLDIRAIAAALLLRHCPPTHDLPLPDRRRRSTGSPAMAGPAIAASSRTSSSARCCCAPATGSRPATSSSTASRPAAVHDGRCRARSPKPPAPPRPTSSAPRSTRPAATASAPPSGSGISERTLRYRLAEMRAVAA